jgi:aspartyl-tRNA(Asn)/glutamyl-tRNA(Gln) amidotransferase subunit B
MSEGSMRCDVNISLREQGTESLGIRTEIKNINSFRFIERAISFETNRQIDILEDGGEIIQETRLYDSELDETRSMRSKEIANDYRYFPEPDLLPIHITDDYISKIRDSMPELPLAKRSRFIETYDITEYDADVLISSRQIADYYEEVVTTCMNSKLAANWIQTELLAKLNKSEQSISESPVSAKKLGLLLSKIVDETISGKIAKQVFSEIWSTGEDPLLLIEKRNLKQMDDSSEIQSIVQTVIDQNADQVKQYLSANEQKRKKLLGYFVGQIMKSSNGKANPKAVNQILSDKLSEQP